jgi:hypothetical protein
MTRADFTDITFVLDRSGSMASIKAATIESFNGFLLSQRGGAGTAQMTLVQFDDQFDTLYTSQPVADAPELTDATYQPRASTALLDAMGRTIVATGQRLARLPEAQRPGTVLFVTLTDGLENASREYTLPRLNQMIAEQRDKYAWQFIFLGANQDAIATAAQMGIGANQALTFSATPGGAAACLSAVNKQVHKVRRSRSAGDVTADFAFEESDRAAARDTKRS